VLPRPGFFRAGLSVVFSVKLTGVGSTDPSHIVIYSGPSLQFTRVEPSKGSITFTLAKSDESTLLEVLNRADGLVTD